MGIHLNYVPDQAQEILLLYRVRILSSQNEKSVQVTIIIKTGVFLFIPPKFHNFAMLQFSMNKLELVQNTRFIYLNVFLDNYHCKTFKTNQS